MKSALYAIVHLSLLFFLRERLLAKYAALDRVPSCNVGVDDRTADPLLRNEAVLGSPERRDGCG